MFIDDLRFAGWRNDIEIPEIEVNTESLGCLASRNVLFTGSYYTEAIELFPDELEMTHAFKLNHSYEVRNGWRQLDDKLNVVESVQGDVFTLAVACPQCNIEISKGKLMLSATFSTIAVGLLSII